MDLYLYRAFLVLMTTQSTLQYSFIFTQSYTHSYSASISSTLLFYEAQFGVQHLAHGHFGMQIFQEDWGSNCWPSDWRAQPTSRTCLDPTPQSVHSTHWEGHLTTQQNHNCFLSWLPNGGTSSPLISHNNNSWCFEFVPSCLNTPIGSRFGKKCQLNDM